MRRIRFALVLAALCGATTQTQAQAPAGGRVKALFLGDNGHHRPSVRAKEILPVLAHRGIDLFYTDDPADLNKSELDQYHVLMLYNNHMVVSQPQLNALLKFVENGGGLVVLHCASASFQNSEEFIRLVGAAFKSHGYGTVTPTITNAAHPVMKGAEYSSWDETYIHTKHNPNRTVLAVHREGGHEEPWTWVRTYGKGRVFYTASGHGPQPYTRADSAAGRPRIVDGSTNVWLHSGFHNLIDNAVKWTAGDWTTRVAALVAAEPKPPEVKLDVPLPVYKRPPAPWNVLESKHIEMAPIGLAPLESFKLWSFRPGMRAVLFASEPLINNVIDFTWDARGRMWALETNDYPNNVLPDSVRGNDRIVILEDTDGDGRADRKTIWADGMNLATSLVFARGGVIVGQAPHMLFFQDTNNDGMADKREILFTGWPRNDTHGTISNMRWGFDNQIWGSVGYNGFRGTVGNVTYDRTNNPMGSGYFRFPTDISTLDYVARTSNNTWGFAFSEDGHAFGSTANRRASNYVHIPGRYYRALGVQSPVLPAIADREDVYPVREIRQVDQFGMYTAGAAHEIYTARAFPEEYWNKIAFVAEPTAHLVGMFELKPNGSAFQATNRWSLFASRDTWTAPVQVKVGPDGAVWVSDFYSLVAQHNPTPMSKEEIARRQPDQLNNPERVFTEKCCVTGPGAAYETPNRDRTHGRIYKIVYDKAPRYTPMRLDNATPAQLVAALSNDNMFWRMTAQQRLVEGKHTSQIPALIRLVNDQTVDGLGLNVGALHALWTLHGLGAIPSNADATRAVRAALNHPAASVRRAALQALPRDAQLLNDIFAAGLLPDRTSPHAVEYTVGATILSDADAHVRLTALLTLSELPASERATASILDLISAPQNARDLWMPDAAAIAGAQQGPGFVTAFLSRRLPNDSLSLVGLRNMGSLLARHYAAQGKTAEVVALITAAPKATVPAIALAMVDAIAPAPPQQRPGQQGPPPPVRGWPENQPPTLTAEQRAALSQAGRDASPELRAALVRVGQRWAMPDLFGQ